MLTQARSVAVLVVLVLAGMVLYDVDRELVPKAKQFLTDADRTVVIVGATATNIEKDTRSWQTKQNQLADSALRATNSLNSDLTELGTLLYAANSALNTQSNSLSSLQASVLRELTTVQELSSSAKPILTQLSATMSQVNASSRVLSDTLTASEPHIIATTANLDASTADAREVADAYKQKLLHPVKSFWHGLKSAFDLAVEILEAHAYFP